MKVLSGDFGTSFYFGEPVTALLAEHLPVTLTLGVSALCFSAVLSVPLSVMAALGPNSWLDRTVLGIALFGQALPTFWLCFFMILLFGVELRRLPISGSASPLLPPWSDRDRATHGEAGFQYESRYLSISEFPQQSRRGPSVGDDRRPRCLLRRICATQALRESAFDKRHPIKMTAFPSHRDVPTPFSVKKEATTPD